MPTEIHPDRVSTGSPVDTPSAPRTGTPGGRIGGGSAEQRESGRESHFHLKPRPRAPLPPSRHQPGSYQQNQLKQSDFGCTLWFEYVWNGLISISLNCRCWGASKTKLVDQFGPTKTEPVGTARFCVLSMSWIWAEWSSFTKLMAEEWPIREGYSKHI